MSDKLVFDYYYGREAEQFSFYRIPRMLVKDPHFSSLSNDAKMLYGLMLDRMSLSVRNGWQDDDDKTYIIYTIEEIMDDLNCAKQKAVKILSELDAEKGIGLVEKKRQGLGKPDIIYVKNFVGVRVIEDDPDFCGQKMLENPCDCTEVRKSNFKKYENQTSRGMKIKPQEVRKSNFKRYENQTSGGMKIKLQEVRNSNPNYNNNNYTDYSNIDSNYTNQIYTENNVNQSNPIYLRTEGTAMPKPGMMDKMDEINATLEYMRDILEYDMLREEEQNGKKVYDMQIVDELIDVMVSAMTSSKPYINIGGEDIPIQQIKSRFEKYDSNILQYVINCMKENTTKVKNIRKYMLAVLFNAPMTINNYYRAEVNHDLYGRK